MNTLLSARDSLKEFYSNHETILVPILKFALAFALLFGINHEYGYYDFLNNNFIVVILAVICALLSLKGTVIISIVFIIIHCFGLGIEVGAIALAIYALMLILYLRFAPDDSLAIILTPFAFKLNIPAVIPIGIGIASRAVSAITGVCAVISYMFLESLPAVAAVKQAEEANALEVVTIIANSITLSKRLIIYCVIFAVVILVVNFIKKIITSYGRLLAIITGAALYMVLMIAGAAFIEIETDVLMLVIGTIVSVIIMIVITFFCFSVKYKESRYLQFEDDDYFYYVKAIPKNKSDKNTE